MREKTVKELIELEICYVAAARDFSRRKMTLLDAAKHYGVSYEELYKMTIMKYKEVIPFHYHLCAKALYDIVKILGSKAITLPLMSKEIMQTLEKVAEENRINLQCLWIEYNYERVALKTYIMNADMSLTLLEIAKRRGTNVKFVICGGCMLNFLPELVYNFVKSKDIQYPKGWDVSKRAGVLWMLYFQATYKYEIKKNFPSNCDFPLCLSNKYI